MFELLLYFFPESAAYLFVRWFGRSRIRAFREAHARGETVYLRFSGRPIARGAVHREPCVLKVEGDRMEVFLPKSRTLLTTRFTRTVLHKGDLPGFHAVYGDGEPIELCLTRTQELVLLQLIPS
ncbi:hypothetical protein [Nocardiopsis valliformis]|uniref:hypothetical protein n=1 Tax=Nocardiopsis valliformis TaxID=239974 RepID=UPI00034822E5|nr:hypothetical protein [Nocardiopsis valliformis]